MNLPNKITILRIIFIPIMLLVPIIASYVDLDYSVLYGVKMYNILLLIIFLIASFTDYIDGYIARKNKMVTNFGKFLDPIADKLLVFTALIMLVETNMIPAWIPIIIAAREFMVSAIRMMVATEGTVIAASMLGKIKTVTQMIAISLAFLDINPFMTFANGTLTGFPFFLNLLMSLAMVVCVFITIWSGIDYFMKSKDTLLKSK